MVNAFRGVFLAGPKTRWKKVLQPGVRKGHWTEEEDAILVKAVGNSAADGTVRHAPKEPLSNCFSHVLRDKLLGISVGSFLW